MTTPDAPPVPQQKSPTRLDRYFEITQRGSNVGREVRGGLVTFFAMAYIIVLNPLIIGTVPDSTGRFLGGGTEPNLVAVAAGTALVAGLMTLVMGAWAKFPIALAAGLGLNAMLAYEIVGLPGMTWEAAMGMVVVEGVLITILVLTGFRTAVFRAVPAGLKTAISAGIGLFIAFIGLSNSRIVTPGAGTPLELGENNRLLGWPVLVFVLVLALMIILHVRKVRGGILIAIVSGTVLALVLERVLNIGAFEAPSDASPGNPTGWAFTVPALEGSPLQLPDFATLFRVDPLGGFTVIGFLAASLLIFSLLLTDFFDTMGTMVGVATAGEIIDEKGEIPHTNRIMLVDSAAAIAGGLGGVSSNTSFVESTAGVAEGARTGLASVVTGLCFLVATLFSPLVEVVPYEAATPALVMVGFLMLSQITDIDFTDPDIGIPAFLTVLFMPLAYSISTGIGVGFLAWVLIKVARGRAGQVGWLMYLIAAGFLVYFGRGILEGL